MSTNCEDCDNLHPNSRKWHPTKWLCLAHKRIEGGNFIAPRQWAINEPYMRCIGINGGDCPTYKPMIEPETK